MPRSGATPVTVISPFRGMKNLIINGDMAINQRYGGGAISAVNSSGYLVDRWAGYQAGGGGAKFNTGRNQLGFSTPDAHIYYLNTNVVSAYTVTATDRFGIVQYIEGFLAAQLMYGTASAKTATLSFWVRSTITGLFGGAIRNSSNNRSYPFTYTISAANTWEKKSITIPGDTSGVWNRTNLMGIAIFFGLGTGTTYKGPAGAWAGAEYNDAVGTVNLVATNGANWNITGVQFEAGLTATEFERRDFATELQLCQRYFEKSYDVETPPGTATNNGAVSGSTGELARNVAVTSFFRTTKRTVPIVSYYDIQGNLARATFVNAGTGAETSNINTISVQHNGFNTAQWWGTTNTAGAAGFYRTHYLANAEF